MKKWIGEVVEAVLSKKAKRATKYISDKQVVNATFHGIRRKRDTNQSVIVTIGRPNYQQREYIKQLKKAKEPFPVRKIILRGIPVLLVLLALPVVANAQEGPMTIIGGAVGSVVEGPNLKSTVSVVFGGLRVAKISPSANLFGALQMENVASVPVNGWGGRLILQNDFQSCKDLSVLMDVGWLSKIAENGDGTRTAGIKVGGGLAYQLGDIIGVFIYGDAHDAGPDFAWSAYIGLYGLNLHSLIPGVK